MINCEKRKIHKSKFAGAQEFTLGAIPRNLPFTHKTRFRGGHTEFFFFWYFDIWCFDFLHFICRSDRALGLPSSPRTKLATDRLTFETNDATIKKIETNDATIKKKPRHLTKVVIYASLLVTPILLTNGFGQSLKDWKILWKEKPREKGLGKASPTNKKKILLWILSLVNALAPRLLINKYLSSKLNQPSQWKYLWKYAKISKKCS